jgi:hypothetical protein
VPEDNIISALILFQHEVLVGFEKCEKAKKPASVVVIYFDVAKAFDTVPHSKMLTYIHSRYNLPTYLIVLLKSYLSGRTMLVKVNDSISSPVSVTSGVPQGSVIGPTLFLAYINAVTDISLSEGSSLILYADDMAMTHALDSENSVNEIQDDIDKISERIKSLALALNVSKCKYQIISLSTVKLSISISLNNTGLEQVQEYKYLGVDVDDKFTFSNHTTRVSCKAKQAIGALCRTLRKWAPGNVFSKIITTLVFPIFLYAIEAWYPPYMKDRVRIERVVKYAARLVSNKFSSELQYDTLLDILNWKPLYRQVAERRLLLIKKYIDRTRFLPEKVFPIIPPSSSRFSQRLRVIQNRHNCILELRRKHRNKLEDSLCAMLHISRIAAYRLHSVSTSNIVSTCLRSS